MVELVTTAHILLGATTDQSVSALCRRGSPDGARYVRFAYIARLTVDQRQQETGVFTLSILFPTWMFCCRPVTQDGMH